jgi:hypothetical protein
MVDFRKAIRIAWALRDEPELTGQAPTSSEALEIVRNNSAEFPWLTPMIAVLEKAVQAEGKEPQLPEPQRSVFLIRVRDLINAKIKGWDAALEAAKAIGDTEYFERNGFSHPIDELAGNVADASEYTDDLILDAFGLR